MGRDFKEAKFERPSRGPRSNNLDLHSFFQLPVLLLACLLPQHRPRSYTPGPLHQCTSIVPVIRQPQSSPTSTSPSSPLPPGTTGTKTHLHKRGNPTPNPVVRTLFPPPLPHDDPLIRTSSDQVRQQRDHDDDPEHTPGTHGAGLIGGRGCAAAEIAGARFEDVGAVVGGADEGEGGVG